MAVTLHDISNLLNQLGVQHKSDGRIIKLTLESQDGVPPVDIITYPQHEGKIFQLAVINILPAEHIQQSPNKTPFLLFLLNLAWQTSFGTPEMDESDGEVRILFEIPLADATMTAGQLHMILGAAINMAHVIRTDGAQLLQADSSPVQMPRMAADSSNAIEEVQARMLVMEQVQHAEGRMMLRMMMNDPYAPETVKRVTAQMLPLMDAMDAAHAS